MLVAPARRADNEEGAPFDSASLDSARDRQDKQRYDAAWRASV